MSADDLRASGAVPKVSGGSGGTIELVVRAHWVNKAVLVTFARPYVRVDGHESPAVWGQPVPLSVSSGTHKLEVFIRYRATSAELGTGHLEVHVPPGGTLSVEARNGALNSTPFTPHEVG